MQTNSDISVNKTGPDLSRRLHKGMLALAAALITFSIAFHFLPVVIHQDRIIANAHGDDDVYVFSVIRSHPERFANDLYGLIARNYSRSSLVHFGSFLISDLLHVPVKLLWLALSFFQTFALPALLCIFFYRRFDFDFKLLFVFLYTLMAGYLSWNLANYGQIFLVPYPAQIAWPFALSGLFVYAHGRMSGVLLLMTASLIHPSIGLYSAFTAGLYTLITGRLFSRGTFFLALCVLCAVLPPLLLLNQPFPKVPDAEILHELKLNMHTTPWSSIYGYSQTWKNILALALLSAVAARFWTAFGRPYFLLLVSSVLASFLLGFSQIVGVWAGIPSLIVLLGLRSITLFSVLILPVLILFFLHHLNSEDRVSRFFAAFLILGSFLDHPYGLDKMPVILMAAWLWSIALKGHNPLKAILKWTVPIFTGIWLALWIFQGEKELIDSGLTAWLVDPAQPAAWQIKAASAIFSLGLALAPDYRALHKAGISTALVLLTAAYFGAFFIYHQNAFKPYLETAMQDYYDAQVWARENTDPNSSFIIPGSSASWRGISERAAFQPRPARYYLYNKDQRIKDFDDRIIRFFGIEKDYSRLTPAQAHNVFYILYYRLPVEMLYELARFARARYLVEQRNLELPLVYQNGTYRIYDMSPKHSSAA